MSSAKLAVVKLLILKTVFATLDVDANPDANITGEQLNLSTGTLLGYRVALQEESTKRLKDTWIYVVGSGLGISLIYGVALVGGSYKKG